jgi:hypothetical protein
MVNILHNYKAFQRTVTRRPDIKAIDRNLSKFFDCEGFIRSKEASCQYFYRELTKTQLFYDCIMNLSFASELEPALTDGFELFAQLCSKIVQQQQEQQHHQARDLDESATTTILELNEHENNQTVVILPPSLEQEFMTKFSRECDDDDDNDDNAMYERQIESFNSAFIYFQNSNKFPALKKEIYLDAAESTSNSFMDLPNESQRDETGGGGGRGSAGKQASHDHHLSSQLDYSNKAETQSNSSANTLSQLRKINKVPNTPIGVRTMAEKMQAFKV